MGCCAAKAAATRSSPGGEVVGISLWRWNDGSPNWQPYPAEVCARLEAAYHTGPGEMQLLVDVGGGRYVDVRGMKQRRHDNPAKARAVRRDSPPAGTTATPLPPHTYQHNHQQEEQQLLPTSPTPQASAPPAAVELLPGSGSENGAPASRPSQQGTLSTQALGPSPGRQQLGRACDEDLQSQLAAVRQKIARKEATAALLRGEGATQPDASVSGVFQLRSHVSGTF
jgi:hypothetical protein